MKTPGSETALYVDTLEIIWLGPWFTSKVVDRDTRKVT